MQSGTPQQIAAKGVRAITDGKLIFAQWPLTNGMWGSVCVNCSVVDPVGNFVTQTHGRGMAMNFRTASDITDDLVQNHGWFKVAAAQLPAYITGAIRMTLAVATGGTTEIMTIPFVPEMLEEGPQT